MPTPIFYLQRGFVKTDLGSIHCVRIGRGAPLLLVHGGHGSWMHWQANLAALSQRYTVLALDMPGYGQSTDVQAGIGADGMAQAVWEAVKKIRAMLPDDDRMHPIGIAGFSFGAIIAARVAMMARDEVQSLLLISPPGLGNVAPEVLDIQARAADAARRNGLRAGLAITLRELMLCQPERAGDEALDLLENAVRNTRFVSRGLSRTERLLPLLRELCVPVHVALGKNDPHQRHELAARSAQLKEALGASAITVASGAAHWLQYDQPERFNELALSFFDSTNRAIDK